VRFACSKVGVKGGRCPAFKENAYRVSKAVSIMSAKYTLKSSKFEGKSIAFEWITTKLVVLVSRLSETTTNSDMSIALLPVSTT
jgi:hypothetical protein